MFRCNQIQTALRAFLSGGSGGRRDGVAGVCYIGAGDRFDDDRRRIRRLDGESQPIALLRGGIGSDRVNRA
jgi:hypothetical protein